jgi:hypothetical protein
LLTTGAIAVGGWRVVLGVDGVVVVVAFAVVVLTVVVLAGTLVVGRTAVLVE